MDQHKRKEGEGTLLSGESEWGLFNIGACGVRRSLGTGMMLGSEYSWLWWGVWGHVLAAPTGPTVGLDVPVSSSVFILRETKSWAAAGSPQHPPGLSLNSPWVPAGGGGGCVAAAGHRPTPTHLQTWHPCARSHRHGAGAAPQPEPIVLTGAGTAICLSLPAASLFAARRMLAQEELPTCFALSLSRRHLMK